MRIRSTGVVIALALAVCAVATAAVLGRDGGKPARAQARIAPKRLYYQDRFRLWSVTLSTHRRKRLMKVDSESAGLAVSRRFIFRTSCGSGPGFRGDGLYRLDRNGTHRLRLIGGLGCPDGLALAGRRVFWVNDANIGSVNVDGTGIRRAVVTATKADLGGVADGLATDGTYMYFPRCRWPVSSIGRARLDGSRLDRRFITLGPKHFCPQSIAYALGHLYWGWNDETTPTGRGVIGRASADGTRVDPEWLDVGRGGIFDVTVGGARVFWTWGGGAGSPVFVGEASLNGRILDRRFVIGDAIAVGP